MKQSVFFGTKNTFSGSDIVQLFSFKTVGLWDSYAILASANHILAMDFAIRREESALFAKKDCFECLSPHGIAA